MPTDGAGQEYREIPVAKEHVRVTHIPDGWNGQPSIRIQCHAEDGRLYPGPEFPVSCVGDIVGAVVSLLSGA